MVIGERRGFGDVSAVVFSFFCWKGGRNIALIRETYDIAARRK